MAYELQQVPMEVVGSSKFGIYPKINLEQTWNMFISDGWLINYAGYKRLNDALDGNEGRGLFHSIRGNFLLVVVDNQVYRVSGSLGSKKIGEINTRFGEVFMDENLSSQICIVDGNDTWIYDYASDLFEKQAMSVTSSVGTFNLVAGYVEYHNSFFLIAPSINEPNDTNTWYAFQFNTAGSPANDSLILQVPLSAFPLQTKPDKCLAVKRLPGRANHVMVIGSSVAEVWSNVGGEENYRRNSSFNIDSGTISASTIAANDQFLCYLSQNEDNAPTILLTEGSSTENISTDGIDNLLQTIKRPDKSTGFFYKQDGHLFYQITFFDQQDNLTLFYDFKEKKFYHASDDDFNFHPARQVAYFADRTVFVGITRGSLFELSTDIDGAFEEVGSNDGNTIPRVRITNTFRVPDSKPFYVNNFSFWIEQGVTDFPLLLATDDEVCFDFMITELTGETMITEGGEIMITEDGFCVSANATRPRVDLSLSKRGNQTFSNIVGRNLNGEGVYRNRLNWHRMGFANEITLQLSFWGLNRFIVNNGVLEIGA